MRWSAVLVVTYLRTVADNTGGRAAVDRNDLSEAVDEMVRESGAYYLVAYQSSNEKKDGRYRKIEVRVGRPGVTVRTRDGYEASRETKAAAEKPLPPELETAMSGFVPRSNVAMRVAVARLRFLATGELRWRLSPTCVSRRRRKARTTSSSS